MDDKKNTTKVEVKDRIQVLVKEIKHLEEQLLLEIQKKETEFFYEIRDKKVHFEEKVRAEHRKLATGILRYVMDASLLNILTAPVIWFLLIPIVFIDLSITFYQFVCFPVYGVPKAKRGDYIIIDRNYLAYLNIFEKINCIYCGYANGVIAFVQEVAARTEQYWCPVKHARKLRVMHSRYRHFMDFGDCAEYKEHLDNVRKDFADLRQK